MTPFFLILFVVFLFIYVFFSIKKISETSTRVFHEEKKNTVRTEIFSCSPILTNSSLSQYF